MEDLEHVFLVRLHLMYNHILILQSNFTDSGPVDCDLWGQSYFICCYFEFIYRA